eukprot:CAMPEP_0197595112 /NCGR_PEP_ID=MMETSP1326-20131121/22062_1 /TAXON_ID=1155430 /ORGANISM="Genus nov. species nov., Strain RCC2288" /LENGTH=367 /DNA_ID=CAMNT_0043161409 /DNA_START=69 /DNA_END=1172 /DNA_ORIENTATION=+
MLAATQSLACPCRLSAPLAAQRRVAASSNGSQGLFFQPKRVEKQGKAPSASLYSRRISLVQPRKHPIVASTRPAPGVSSGVGSGGSGGAVESGVGLRVGALLLRTLSPSSSSSANTRRSVAALVLQSGSFSEGEPSSQITTPTTPLERLRQSQQQERAGGAGAGAGAGSDPSTPLTFAQLTWIEKVEYTFVKGSLVWARCFVMLGVVATLILSGLLFSMGLKEVLYHSVSAFMNNQPAELVGSAVGTLDKFLLGMVCLVFGLGSYELFLVKGSSSDRQRGPKIKKPDWLKVKSIDDLEQKVGEIIVAVMVVNILELSMHMHYTQPLHLVYAGLAALMSAAALALLHWSSHASSGSSSSSGASSSSAH